MTAALAGASIGYQTTMVEFDARSPSRERIAIIAHDSDHRNDSLTVWKALYEINGRCAVNIEIKDPSVAVEIADQIIDLTSRPIWKMNQFVVSSFHHETVFEIKRRIPALCVGAIMDCVPALSYLNTLHALGVANLHMQLMNADMDTQNGSLFMKRAKELGMHVWVWTVNDLATAQRVFDWGAERIFTDKPCLFV